MQRILCRKIEIKNKYIQKQYQICSKIDIFKIKKQKYYQYVKLLSPAYKKMGIQYCIDLNMVIVLRNVWGDLVCAAVVDHLQQRNSTK